MSHASRRAFLGGTLASLAAPAIGASTGPIIRIGCITALTGAQEVLGRPILNGARIAADQINDKGGVQGRLIEVVEADAHADPATAVQWTRELARDRVNLLCGCVTSDLALAVSAALPAADAVMITCSAQTEKLTHEAFVPNVFRVTDHAYMRCRAQAHLMAQRYPDLASWAAILPDSEYGRSAWAAFHDGLMEGYSRPNRATPTIAAPIFARFGEIDFRTHVAALHKTGAEGLLIAVYGDDGIAFYGQAREAGLLAKVKVLADPINEFLVPQTLGASTPEHLWLASSWYYGGYRSLPMARQLYDDHLARTGNPMPLGFVNAGHSAVNAYAAAIAKAGSTGTAAIIASLAGLTFVSAKGPVTFRAEDHQAICDVNFIRIKSSPDPMPMEITDNLRPDVEIAEFVRLDGDTVLEPPSPGQKLAYRYPA
jgi:branched-chain amino acid transport system substrate-binding protein